MDTGKLFEKTRSWSKTLFLIPLTLILFLFAFFFSPFLTEGYVEGEGVVLKSEAVYTTNDEGGTDISYDTTFSYTVDGVTREQTYNFNDQMSVGDKLTFYYDPKNPEKTSSSKNNEWLWLIFVGLGLIAGAYTVYSVVVDRKRGKRTDELRNLQQGRADDGSPIGQGEGGYRAEDVDEKALTEYYFRFDGRAFMPGYILEDGDRKPVFAGKMTQNLLVVPRKFAFTDYRTNETIEHKVSHVITSSENDFGMFSTRSSFRLDGVNVWDYLHEKGVLINNGFAEYGAFITYDVTQNGKFLARVKMSSIYVHEEDEEGKTIKIPHKMYYRVWTDSKDLELVFTVVFAISETEQLIYN